MDLNQLTLLQKKLKEEEEAKMAMEPSMAFEAPSMPNPVPQPPSTPPPVEATTNLPTPTPLPSPPPEVAEPLPIAQADKRADEILDATGSNLSSAERTQAKVLALKQNSGEEVPPGVEETRQQLSQVADNQDAMEVVLKGRENAGKSRVESMAGLLSLALPVLIGAAVGGKRGALYGVQGAGTQMLKEMDQDREDQKEIEKEEKAAKALQEARDYQVKKEKDMVDYRARKEGSGQDEIDQTVAKTLAVKEANNLSKARDEYDKIMAVNEEARLVLDQMQAATGGMSWAEFQLKGQWSNTQTAQIKNQVRALVFKKIKAIDSRPSDFDVRSYMEIMTGDWTSNPETAYNLLKNAIESDERIAKANLRLKEARVTGKPISEEDQALIKQGRESRVIGQEIDTLSKTKTKSGNNAFEYLLAQAKKIKAAGKKVPRDLVYQLLEREGVTASDLTLKSMGLLSDG